MRVHGGLGRRGHPGPSLRVGEQVAEDGRQVGGVTGVEHRRRGPERRQLVSERRDVAFIDKRRPKGTQNVAEAIEVVGEVEGRVCVLVDDMIDTAGTIAGAAQLLHRRGAADVVVAATHGVLSGPAVDRLRNAPIREVVVSNTLEIPAAKQWDGLRVVSIAPIIAEALSAVFTEASVSEIFHGDNV